MDRPAFVYTTYINTNPEMLWRALTDPAFTRRYWRVAFESDWDTGSTYIFEQGGVRTVDPEQVVVESDPYRRLSYRWLTFTKEWAELNGFSDELLATISSERRSKVTFDIEPAGQLVKLTVVHDDFDPGSTVASMISEGWPHVLSSLKTLLETGEPLPL
jgi:uncharacterized protein YndB with AHSA1/START domain